jgi:phosphate transport system substrate-binding protein
MTLHLKRMICVGAAVFGATATTAVASASAASIPEAGSSLVYPLVSIWQNHYSAATIAPAAGGSSTGISDIQANSVDIGASDAPMTSSQYSGDSHSPVEIPWALTATGVGYNIPGIKSGLKLNATILAEIYTGKISNWNNKAILALNPNYAAKLKKAGKITPVFRSDGSGDSFAFQNFLLKGAPKYWKTPPSTAFAGTTGEGENGNAGVAGEVHSNSGTIGYISAAYLIQQNIHVAALENAAGNFELPNATNIANAASSDSSIPAQGMTFTNDLGVPIQYPSKKYKTAYPVSTYTYAIVNTSGSPKSGAVSDIQAFLTWATTTGQAYGGTLDFVPLPAKIRSADARIISSI